MLNERMKELSERSERMNNKKEANETKCKASLSKISDLKKSMSFKSKKHKELSDKLEMSRTKLGREKDNRRENAHSQRQAEYLERLQDVFKGIHGRLVDLIKPRQRKYALAITQVLGRNYDAVVVDTASTASDCIQYLREQRLGRMDFLPLDNLRPKALDESLRELGGSCKLASDVILFDDSIAKAVQFACNNSIVCSTLDEARELRFKRKIDVKVVTLKGHVINKTGYMTGGVARSHLDRARIWEQKDFDRLRREMKAMSVEVNTLENEIGGIEGVSRRRGELGTIVKNMEEEQRNLSTLKAQLKYIKEDCENTSKKIEETRRDVTAVKRSMEKLRPERERLERSISNRDAQISKIEKERNEIKRDILGDISERFGVDDIEEADRQREEQTREMNAEESALKDKTSKLNSQITYQKRRGKKLEEAKLKLDEKVCSTHTHTHTHTHLSPTHSIQQPNRYVSFRTNS